MSIDLDERLRLLGDHLDDEWKAHADGIAVRPEPMRRSFPPRTVLTLAAALLVIVGVVGVLARRSDSTPRSASTASTEPTTIDSTVPDPHPVGRVHALSWRQLEPPTFSLEGYSYAGTLPDGRAVLWNGTEATESVTPRDVRLAFYDPASSTWARSSQFTDAQLFGNDAEIVGDLVIVHQYMNDGSRDRFVRFDIGSDVWTASPDLPAGLIASDWAADDTTIAAWAFPLDDREARTLVRWSGETAWQKGASAPFAQRSNEGTAHDGARLVVYGGLSREASTATVSFPDSDGNGTAPTIFLGADAPYAALDGGIYDVTADAWTQMPVSPLTGVAYPTVLLDGDTIVVAGGQAAVTAGGSLDQLATYQPSIGWQLSTFDPAWRGGGVSVVGQGLITSNSNGYLVSEAPFDSWQVYPEHDIQISWQPTPLGHARYLQAYHVDEVVHFLLADDGVASEAPATPWTTSPETGYASTVIPADDGPIIIDGATFALWQLSIDN